MGRMSLIMLHPIVISGSIFTISTTTPAFEQVGYAQTSTDGNLYYTINESGSVEVSPHTAPEPATWAMMLLGFAGLGFLAYRKRGGLAAA